MEKSKIITVLWIAIVVCQSCGPKLPLYTVREKQPDFDPRLEVNDYYDEKAKLGYTVLKDDQFLYVNISTRERSAQTKILRGGVQVFLDVEGKMNETVYFHYPITSEGRATGNSSGPRGERTTFLENRIKALGDEILFVKNEDEQYINRLLNNDGTTATLSAEQDELYYELKFPIGYLIATGSKPASLGIAVEGLPTRSVVSDRQPTAMRSGGRGGGSSMSGGRGGGRRAGGRRTNAPARTERTETDGLGTDIDIWFRVELKE